MTRNNPRAWIWIFMMVEFVGLTLDALWHGVLHRDFEAGTVGEMARHLTTVHLPLYVGAASVLVATANALVRRIRRSTAGVALPIAFAGAVLSAGAEAWHAWSHLRLDTHGAPIAGILSVVGFLVVVIALSLSSGRWARYSRPS